MRIVTWNCNLNFKSKFERVSELKPDILIIQECERLPEDFFPNAQYLWVGQYQKKGLGVLIFGGSGKIHSSHRHDLVEFIPVDTDYGSLLGVWAFNHRAKQRYGEGFDGVTENAITHYEDFIREKSTLGVVGDFNNSVIWDKNNSKTPFQITIEKFETFGLYSAYHKQNAERFGKETKATLYHTKNSAKPYHIDYMFTRQSVSVAVGTYDDWIEFSDHMPLTVNLK